MVAVGRRYLPRGWADFGLQLAIWFAFVFAYQLARGVANRESPERAFANGWRVVNIETHFTHRLYELTFQQFVDQRHWLATAVSWTDRQPKSTTFSGWPRPKLAVLPV